MSAPTYASREQFKTATDTHTSLQLNTAIDRVLQSASRNIEKRFHRHFYPKTESVTYSFTGGGQGFWLNRDLQSLTSVTVDDTAQTVADLDLYPSHYGPPYSWLGAMGSEVVVVGVWGYSNDTVPAGALAEDLDGSETGVDITDSSLIGVGDLITVDSERMVVTEKSLADTTADLAADLTADNSDVSATVDDGSLVNAGETITIDSERMFVESISSNTLTVIRAYDGSVLATHDGTSTPASVYASRTLTVERGAAGSTAATHSDTTSITKNYPPPQITALCLAEAEVQFAQERAQYARTVGSGDGEREAAGKGLADARSQASSLMRRRKAAV